MKFISTLVYAAASVSCLTFSFPHSGISVKRTSPESFTLVWAKNPAKSPAGDSLEPDDAQYVLGLCEPSATLGGGPTCTSLHMLISTASTQMAINGKIFPKAGTYSIGAYRLGHSGPKDFPKYRSQFFKVTDI